jgi:hypothetical protein
MGSSICGIHVFTLVDDPKLVTCKHCLRCW